MGQTWSYFSEPSPTIAAITGSNEVPVNQQETSSSHQNESSETNIDISKSKSKINEIENVSNDVSCLETEFNRNYKRQSNIVYNLEETPCKFASKLIINCLKENPMQIGKCKFEIDEYTKCVHAACMLKFKKL